MAPARTILIVDDDPDIHYLLAAALAGEDYRIEDAYDGAQALSFLEAKACDLVITDVRMPALDGLELLHRIREARPGTRVLVMTAESTPATVISSLRDHALGYFSKPFSLDGVVDVVARALRAPPSDDGIKVLSAIPQWISLQLPCKLEIADQLITFMQEIGTDLSAQEREDVGSAFRELLMNAIEHGGHSDPDKTIRVDYVRTVKSMIYKIWDPGEGFSFDDLKHAAVSNGPEAPFEHADVRARMGLRPGGFGILLTRNLADELIYNQKGNEVLLIKYVAAPSESAAH